MKWRDFNPFRLRHTGLPPNLVLVARLMALTLLVRGDSVFRINLPYLELLDSLGPPAAFNMTLRLTADAGYLLVIFTPWVRLGAGSTGGAYLVGLLACRPCHSVAHTYVACLLVIVALSSWASRERLLRAQLVILYAGAAINKSLDVDWWNGRYFDALMLARYQHETYAWVAALLPPGWLSIAMGATTVVLQWVLAWCFLSRRWTPTGIAIGVVFHTAMVVALANTFGPFFYALLITYVGLGWHPSAAPPEARPERPPERADRQRQPHPEGVG